MQGFGAIINTIGNSDVISNGIEYIKNFQQPNAAE